METHSPVTDQAEMLNQCCDQACQMYEQALDHNNACLEKAALGLLVTLLPKYPGWIIGKVHCIGVQGHGDSHGMIELLQAIAEQDFDWSPNILESALKTLENTKMWFWQKRGLRRQLQSRLEQVLAA